MKIYVAMSGGVDSSTCAYLLKQQGYEIIGLTVLLYDNYPYDEPKKLCKRLGIEHIVLDLKQDFQQNIIDDFNEKIKNGETPVPCVLCNRHIKLGKLLEFCENNNGKLATGHYAIIENNKIYKAKDCLKDQTHFLCDIKKSAIQNLIFPLGKYLKSEVFRIAKEQNLVDVSAYKESQEVCFFHGKTYNDYVKSLNIEEQNGEIKHIATNKILGKHNGLLKYTIGQRQGIGVAWTEPLYVVKRDFEKNILYVGEEDELYSKELYIKDINFLVDEFENLDSFKCKVCLRDKTPLLDVEIIKENNNQAKVILQEPARAITSGQWCVMYQENMLIGGGKII